MPKRIIAIYGPSGAGKSLQAERLAERRDWVHISSGELTREHPTPEVKKLEDAGQLAPSDYIEELMEEALAKVGPQQTVILDGFPRTLDDVRWMSNHGYEADVSILLDVPEEESLKRILARGRSDDSEAALKVKLDRYYADTLPVIDQLKMEGSLVKVDGRGTPDEVTARIEDALEV